MAKTPPAGVMRMKWPWRLRRRSADETLMSRCREDRATLTPVDVARPGGKAGRLSDARNGGAGRQVDPLVEPALASIILSAGEPAFPAEPAPLLEDGIPGYVDAAGIRHPLL